MSTYDVNRSSVMGDSVPGRYEKVSGEERVPDPHLEVDVISSSLQQCWISRLSITDPAPVQPTKTMSGAGMDWKEPINQLPATQLRQIVPSCTLARLIRIVLTGLFFLN